MIDPRDAFTVPSEELTDNLTIEVASGYPDAGQPMKTTLGDFADFLGSSIVPFWIVVLPGESIQAAINALPTTGGMVILTDNATYTQTSPVSSSKPNIRIWAATQTAVIQRGPVLGGTMFLLSGNNCLIEGVTFDGNGSLNITGNAEVQLGGANSRITECRVINFAGSIGVALSGTNCRADHNTITGMGTSPSTQRNYGVWAINNVPVSIDHNTITGTGIDGIGANGGGTQISDNYVSGCHCYTGGPGGQIATYPSTGGTPIGVLVEGNFVGAGGATGAGGLELVGDNVRAVGNLIEYTGTQGISLRAGAGICVADNTVYNIGIAGNFIDGIYISAGVTDFQICGNRVIDDRAPAQMRFCCVINTGASDRYVITDNLFQPTGTQVPLFDGGTGINKVIAKNAGVDDVVPPILSAATTTFPVNPVITLNGSATITAIAADNQAIGRSITIIPTGAPSFVGGSGTIGNSISCVPNVPLVATFNGTNWYLSSVSGGTGSFTSLSVSGASTLTGAAAFGNGATFGSQVATGVDLSKHIALFSTNYGFNVTSGSVNVVVAGTNSATFIGTGINGTNIGFTTPAVGCFTALSAGSDAKTGTGYSIGTTECSLLLAPSGTFTLVLPTAAAPNVGRIINLKLTTNFAVNSASSNVVPLVGGSASTAILAATAGKYCMLQSDGANWQIMAAN